MAARLYDEHADLYDLAFEWDIEDEVDWLLARFGPGCASVLEPGCGSGRVLARLVSRGLAVTGVDNSPGMLAAARKRLGDDAELVQADIADFDLGRRFDAAICPINTLGHLTRDDLPRHLGCMAAHLLPGARYLVQLDLRDPDEPPPEARPWEVERAGVRARVEWSPGPIDGGVERQRSRIEVLTGERSGEVVEEEHPMTVWTPAAWAAAIAVSPFEYAAVYDGDRPERPRVEPGGGGHLLWHELVR